MRILHTADWHLGDRLGRIDRTEDLKKGVERIAAYCESEGVEALLVAGDLFSEMSRPDALKDTIGHLRATFGPFLAGGGTILALTGNHDNETFCQTLRHTLGLGTPGPSGGDEAGGGLLAPGRLHLADSPALWRLADRSGEEVQFVLMPYPSPARYFDGDASGRYLRRDDKHRALRDAFAARLDAIRRSPAFRPDLPSVLAAHVHVDGARLSALPFRMSERDSLVLPASIGDDGWAYVALGHIHHAQALNGRAHIRYCGGLDRLDQGERDDPRGALLIDVGPSGLESGPRWLPLDATPMLDLTIRDPALDLPALAEQYPDASRVLVRYRLHYRPGRDDLDAVLARLEDLFPRWHDREIVEDGAEPSGLAAAYETDAAPRGFHEVVIDYLNDELIAHPDRDAILALAETFLAEEG